MIAISGAIYYSVAHPPVVGKVLSSSGSVDIHNGEGWIPAFSQMELHERDVIRTQEGKATIILREQIIVDIDENTEVLLQDFSFNETKLYQSSGSMWSKVMDLGGFTYEVETPTAVALVRGTSFGTSLQGISVGEGNVLMKKNGKIISLDEGRKGIVEGGRMVAQALNDVEIEDVQARLRRTQKHLQDIRLEKILNDKFVMAVIKQHGVDANQLKEIVRQIDNGERSPDELLAFVPENLRTKTVTEVHALSKHIDKQQKAIERAVERRKDLPDRVERRADEILDKIDQRVEDTADRTQNIVDKVDRVADDISYKVIEKAADVDQILDEKLNSETDNSNVDHTYDTINQSNIVTIVDTDSITTIYDGTVLD